MTPAVLIRNARLRAGLSQVELAKRLGSKQPVVARWESGSRSPSFTDVLRAVRACGFELDLTMLIPDEEEGRAVSGSLALTPKQRLQRNRNMLRLERRVSEAKRVKP